MTEYEIVDAAGTFYGIAIAMISLYFTVVSAYLVTAYIVGKELGQSQVIVISGLFLFIALASTWGSFTYLRWAASFVHSAPEVFSIYFPSVMHPLRPYNIVILIQIVGIFACLMFMWQARHPKAE